MRHRLSTAEERQVPSNPGYDNGWGGDILLNVSPHLYLFPDPASALPAFYLFYLEG